MTVEYQLHLPDYIAKCINKDIPKLHCNGQCVLMQKIKEKEKNDAKKNLIVYELTMNYVHHEFPSFDLEQPYAQVIAISFPSYTMDYHYSFHSPVFRPPIS